METTELMFADDLITAGPCDGEWKLRILWAIGLDPARGLRHGANLRFFNISRELVARGHEVYFLFDQNSSGEAQAKREYLEKLKQQSFISGYFETAYQHPKWRGKLSAVVAYPPAMNWLLRKNQEPARAAIARIISDRKINLCIFNNRNLLFLVPPVGRRSVTFIDWTDSYVLQWIRQIKLSCRQRDLSRIPILLRYLTESCIQEHYYGRRCDANITVSPVDKRYLDFVTRTPERNRVILNGLSMKVTPPRAAKIRNRIIFTGNMDFWPNQQAALWFIGNVLPLLTTRNPHIKFVVAGANPGPELLAKAGEYVEVTGYVDDIAREIAQSELYVAPLVSGGGFKNKIIEAVASGTYVIATSLAVEFLGADFRSRLLIADGPHEIADCVLSYLEDPQKYDAKLAELQRMVQENFTWGQRAEELIATVRETCGSYVGGVSE